MLLGDDGALALSIFAEMSALAVATGAINLGQGFPDEDGPPEVIDAARQAIADGVNQYPPGRGMPVLRQAIAAHQARWYGIHVDSEREVLVTAGATEALTATILALSEPGDELVVFEPFYDLYGAVAELAGVRLVTVPLVAAPFGSGGGFEPDLEALGAAVTERTRLILVNSPHNPTGAVLGRETLELLVALAERFDAIIVTDEVYEHLTFGVNHVPVATLPGAAERTVTISSAAKTFSVTGWKIGWVIARPALIGAILSVKQFLTYVNGAPFQPAIAAGLALPDSFFVDAAATLQAKRDLLDAGLTAAGFSTTTPSAGYFIVADAAALGVGSPGMMDAAAFCRELPVRAGVVAVPVTAFVREERRAGYASLLRFAFCKRAEVLEEAVARLGALARP
jgi:N-succinyldiaminopimelate aminotransferase